MPSTKYRSRDLLQLLDLQTWGQRLLQLLGLLLQTFSFTSDEDQLQTLYLVGDLEGVEEARATDLELNVVSVLLYLDALGILPPSLQEEILDLLDLTWHRELLKPNYG